MDHPPAASWQHPTGRRHIDNSWSKKLEDVTEASDVQMRTAYFRPIWRWLGHVQNDFAARADWCVKDFASANHHPIVRLRNTKSDMHAVPGDVVTLDATPTTDPDGDRLTFR
jgi:hypothetical protein